MPKNFIITTENPPAYPIALRAVESTAPKIRQMNAARHKSANTAA